MSALALACIGLYGVMAYSVGTRRREICIRMALGAERRAVIGHVLKDGVRLMIVGVFLGVAAALAHRAAADQRAVSGEQLRSAGDRRNDRLGRDRGDPRVLDAGLARRPLRSDQLAAQRLIAA